MIGQEWEHAGIAGLGTRLIIEAAQKFYVTIQQPARQVTYRAGYDHDSYDSLSKLSLACQASTARALQSESSEVEG